MILLFYEISYLNKRITSQGFLLGVLLERYHAGMWKKAERYSVDDEEEGDIYDPKSKGFCRACVDVTKFGFLKPGVIRKLGKDEVECPPDKNELGRATWTLLHTIGAYYPLKPTYKQQEEMKAFLNSFASFYPCRPCAADFQSNLQLHPPKLESRQSLTGWICMQHNIVNKKIGKPLFDCTHALERWRYGWKNKSDCNLPDQD